MKRYLACGLLLSAMLVGCDSDDSIEQAAEQSVQQFEAAGVEDMKNDALFAAEAASANMLMVQLSEAALNRGVSPDVKQFAQEVETTHSQMLNELQQMAQQANLTLPQTLGKAHQRAYDQLIEKEGLSFDVEFIRLMQDQHKEILNRYEDIAEHGNSMEVKQYASKQLPLLRQRTEAAKRLEDKID